MNIRDLFGKEYTDGDIIDCLTCESDEVWANGCMNKYRWYSVQECVVEYKGIYFKYFKYIITGDACMSDMDLEYNLDDFTIVQKKERTITETYYD